MEIGIPRVSLDKWRLNFDKIFLSNGNNTFLTGVELSYEFGLIYGSHHYYNLIKENFFDKYKKQCEIRVIREDDFYYVCDNNINLNGFPDLIFMKDGFNFTLTKNDLWKKFNNKYYFLVVFPNKQKYDWVLGRIFFQKYIIFFNQDAKLIGFYPSGGQKIDKDGKKNKIQLSWILVILLFIFLSLSIIYIVYYLKMKKRKIRVNELEENYEYEYVSEKNNKEHLQINED